MLTWLNKMRNRGWDYIDHWGNAAFIISVVCFFTPIIWGTWEYWTAVLANIPEDASLFLIVLLLVTFTFGYLLLLSLTYFWAYASFVIGAAVSALLLPLIWLYRKICP